MDGFDLSKMIKFEGCHCYCFILKLKVLFYLTVDANRVAGKGYIRYKLRKIPNAGPKIMPFRSKAYVKIKYIAFSKCLKNIRIERVQKIMI